MVVIPAAAEPVITAANTSKLDSGPAPLYSAPTSARDWLAAALVGDIFLCLEGPNIHLKAGLIKSKVVEWGQAEARAKAASKEAAAGKD
jgi:hypothetical protein